MNCGACKHWDLAGNLGQHGYGQCKERTEARRTSHTTSAQNPCRIGKFARAEPKVIKLREAAQTTLL